MWLGQAWIPGLAMSRALGDGIARRYSLLTGHAELMSQRIGHAAIPIAMLRLPVQRVWPGRRLLQHDVGAACTFSPDRIVVSMLTERPAAHRAGVISQPEVCTVDLGSADEFLVMGSDGLFELLTNQEIVDAVAACPCTEDACAKASASMSCLHVDVPLSRWTACRVSRQPHKSSEFLDACC